MYNGYGLSPIPRGGGLFSRLFSRPFLNNINWGTMLSNTQKTLNIINQAIPVFYQVKPIVNNAKTMFKIIGAVKGSSNDYSKSYNSSNTGNNITNQSVNSSVTTQNTSNNNQPIFYL